MASNETNNSNPCTSEEELKSRLKTLVSNPSNLEAACNDIFDNLLEIVLIGEVFDVHRNRFEDLPSMSNEDKKENSIDINQKDNIYANQPKKKKIPIVNCQVCSRSVAAVKYAPHLETCLGMGRRSKRAAANKD